MPRPPADDRETPPEMPPVFACVLIGGRSSRMGRPKHLLPDRTGITWLERTVRILQPLVAGVILSGGGEVPRSLERLDRLADIPGAAGPLAGILAAMRWRPDVTWLLAACDMPDINTAAVQWLLGRQRHDLWGTVPRLRVDGPVEPLLALYGSRCAPLFEDLLLGGCLRIGMAARHPMLETPVVPEHLQAAWRNVNTPEEYAAGR